MEAHGRGFLALSVGVENRSLTEFVSLTGNMAEEAGVEPTKPVINRLHRV